MQKIVVENLFKVFGPHPERALALLERGQGKEEILKKTGLGVGVNNASFEVAQGEIVVVMGLSGSGKSTLVRCVNRLLEPTAGRVLIDGTDIRAWTPKACAACAWKSWAWSSKFRALPPPQRGAKHRYGLEIKGMAPDERREKAMQALALVGLSGWRTPRRANFRRHAAARGPGRALALDPDFRSWTGLQRPGPLIRRDMQDELLNLQDEMQ
jgi:glycine betaine/proline transport system ATP-binding protein